jgi:hypothetical protein
MLYISPINFGMNFYAFVCNWRFYANFAFKLIVEQMITPAH